MSTARRVLAYTLLPLAALVGGCSFFMGVPVAPHVIQGGFTVLVDGAGQPTAARAAADIGAFAQTRGFVRVSAPPAPDRYVLGKIVLEVGYAPDQHRVSAYLRSSGSSGDRNVIAQFNHDFHQRYARSYGDEDPISETVYSDVGSVAPAPSPRGPVSQPGR